MCAGDLRVYSPNPPSDAHPTDQLFTVRLSLDSETLLANAAQDIASAQALTGHLAFEIDGVQREIALAVHRMLEGIQLMVDRVLDLNDISSLNTPVAS
ncbi:DUF6124 family protein [Pseudomonas sp. P7548]|uniref:DUF6124 family protein n=1 Tax=Pseudomonas sp. P7548 TaxID=2726981 RepID=UPI002116142A|nr:DUF6124 family protein [Pseudomonas sp. P7548]